MAGAIAGWMHRHHRLEDNTDARVRSFMDYAGLVAATTLRRAKMFFVLRLAYYQAFAPEPQVPVYRSADSRFGAEGGGGPS